MILIIGAGLSGLITAYRLKQAGIPFKLLEARNRIGGRIHTAIGTNNTSTEMGATWFTQQHRNLIGLLKELEIGHFNQQMDQRVFYQASASSPIESFQIPQQQASYRISNGTSALINRLIQEVKPENIFLNQVVSHIQMMDNGVQIKAKDTFHGDAVVLALPPKLWAHKIIFDPVLPSDLIQVAKQTHTWMEDSIKVALTYKEPFWKEKNQSGTFFSNAGPLTEFYDHSNQEQSKFALCGFLQGDLKSLSSEARKKLILNQVELVFGQNGLDFLDYKECVWSQEEYTFEALGGTLYAHQNNGNPIFNQFHFKNQLFISGAESALEFPGYMDGAVYSGNATAERIVESYTS